MDIAVVLAVVVESKGSSPGRVGFKLAITSNDCVGTVGGGVMESNIISLGREMIQIQNTNPVLKELLHYRNAEPHKQSGLMCSGSQNIVLVLLDQSMKQLISDILKTYDKTDPIAISINSKGISLITSDTQFSFTMQSESEFHYTERVGNPKVVFICGAGHVGSAISKALSILDFKIIIIDSRKPLPEFDRFYHEIKHTPYTDVRSIITPGNDSYVLIVTSERESDQEVLFALQDRTFRYIGLMGSRTKIKSIYEFLKQNNVSQEFINKIHAPIGIGIPNQTPEEIGISVAAKLIEMSYS